MTTPTPDWAVAVPSTKDVHLPPNPKQSTRPLTNQQLAKLGQELMEQFLRRVVAALTGLFMPGNGTALSQLLKWAQDLIALLGSMDSLTDWKAASGTNLFPSPHFDALNLKRSPVAPAGVCDYSTEQHHSGLRSWKWLHFPGTDSGLILAPTPRIDYVEVGPTESWFAEAWVHPKSTNSTATGSIRIGATFTDSSGVKAATDLYLDCPLNGPDMVKGQFNKINVTLDVPDGMDRAVFWVKSTAATADSSAFYVDDVVLREETFALKAKVLADMANFVVDLRARAGTNLVVSPAFENASVNRFPYNTNQIYGYARGAGEQRYSGLQSWKWTQKTSAACGLILAPTINYDSFEVKAGEGFFAEAFVHPSASNSTATGAIRIGATFTDSSGSLSPTDLYNEFPLSGPDMVKGQFNKVNINLDVPTGYDTAKFWVIATAETAASSVFWIDSVTLREDTESKAALAQANFANFVTDMKARAGTNAVCDPRFTLGRAVTRFPLNVAQDFDYTNEQHHTGIWSWKWTQKTSAACGLVLAPTPKYDSFQVAAAEAYFVECYFFPKSTNGTSGAVRIGATLTDSTGTLSPVDVFMETALSAAGAARNQWNRLSCTLTIQDGYDTAKFWIMTTSATAAGGVFMVDDVCVRETSQPQNIIDKIYEAIVGAAPTTPQPSGTLVDRLRETFAKIVDGLRGHPAGTTTTALPSDVHAAATELKATADVAVENAGVATELAQSANDPNLVTNPRWESDVTPLYSAITVTDPDAQMMLSTDHVHTTGRSVKTIGTRNVYPMIQTYSAPWEPPLWMPGMITCVPNDVIYAEAWIYNPSGNFSTTGGYATIEALKDGYASPVGILDDSFGTFGGLKCVDVQTLTVNTWTRLWGYFTVPSGWNNVGFRLVSNPVVPGSEVMNTYYWGDPVVMRVTDSYRAARDAAAAQTQASIATTNAATAQASASTAQTAANTAASDLSSSLNNMAGGLLGGAQTATPTTIRDKILAAWGQLFDGLNGSSGSSARLITEVGTAAAAVRSTASTASTNAATAQASASTAQSTASGAQSAIAATNTALYGGSSAGSAIIPAALPTDLRTLGNGFLMRKTSGTISVSCSANTATAIKFATSAYDSSASNSGDYTLSTGGSGELKVKAVKKGYYAVEVSFGLDQNARAIGYRLAAAVFLNGSLYKPGSTVDYYGSYSTQFPFCAQAMFIVPMDVDDYVTPGCVLYSQSTISGLPLIATNMNRDTMFALSLLNRAVT